MSECVMFVQSRIPPQAVLVGSRGQPQVPVMCLAMRQDTPLQPLIGRMGPALYRTKSAVSFTAAG